MTMKLALILISSSPHLQISTFSEEGQDTYRILSEYVPPLVQVRQAIILGWDGHEVSD